MNELDAVKDLLAPAPPRSAVVGSARRMLDDAVAGETSGIAPIHPASVASRRRHRRVAAAVATVAAAAAAVGVAVASSGAPSTKAPSSPSPGHRVVLSLAAYRLSLPKGFHARTGSCLSSPPPGVQPETVLQSMRSAASSDGGCLEATLAAGDAVVPAGAEPVTVGTQSGDYVAGADGAATLFVAIPAAHGVHYLVLSAQGLSESELIAIAASAFPSS